MENQSKLKTRLPLIFSAIPFLISGVDTLLQGSIFFGAANLAMGIVNLAALKFIEKLPAITNAVLFLLNAMMALLTAYQYKIAGKRWLPYAWLAVCAVNLILTVVVYRKSKVRRNS